MCYLPRQALDLGTVVVGRLVPGRLTCRVRTLAPEADAPQEAEFTLPAAGGPRVARGPQHWLSYVQGVIQFFAEGASTSEAASEGVSEAATKPSPSPSQKPRAYEEGLELVVASNVPLGGGLSSSASLEVATYTLLAQLYLEPGHVCASPLRLLSYLHSPFDSTVTFCLSIRVPAQQSKII